MAECEAVHELLITPDQLREVAMEMDRKRKSEQYQAGQVIRFKFNNLFSFIYKPDAKPAQKLSDEEVTEILQELNNA